MALLEVACFSLQGAILASQAGADRIELCDNRSAGGITPPLRWVSAVKRQISIPVHVMIRPRDGNFDYSAAEFDLMKAAVDQFRADADGFVFGILTSAKQVDVTGTAELVRRASPLPCTFHRAFDETPDLLEALERVIASGCKALLSSGGASSAQAGIETLEQLVRMSRGRITVLPGGGVRASNISAVQSLTGASILHSSACLEGDDEPDADDIRRMKCLLQQRKQQPPPLSG